MATSLRHNLTSAYLDAAHKFSSKKGRRRIVAYVESYDDIAFWRTLLAEFENEERYFQVMLPSATSLAKGKKMGRPKLKRHTKAKATVSLYKNGMTIDEIQKQLGIKSKSSIYRFLRIEGIEPTRKPHICKKK